MNSRSIRAFVAALALSIGGPASANPPISIGGPNPTNIGTVQPSGPTATNIGTLQPGLTTWSDHNFDDVSFKLPKSWQVSTGNNRYTAGDPKGDWYIKFMGSTKNYSTPNQAVDAMVKVFQAGNFKLGGTGSGFDYDLSTLHFHQVATGNLNGEPMIFHFIAFRNGSGHMLVRFNYKQNMHTTMKKHLEGILNSVDAP